MAETITKRDLDAAGCGKPDCGHDHSVLYVHGTCHMEAPTWVRYEKASETLIVTCSRCDAEVIRIKLSATDRPH